MKKWLKRLLIIVGVLVVLFLLGALGNYIDNIVLRKYINTFEPVQYAEDRVVPQLEGGHYTITTDNDLKIMHITDIHIGGGFLTYKNDKKTIYEVITMLQKEKPDIVVLGGDNTYCMPPFGFNGGATINNRQAAKTLISIFTHEQVYFTTVFGNHDTEAFNIADRTEIGELYMNDDSGYCFFKSEFTDLDAESVPSVSNQFVIVKKSSGEVTKLLLMLDSNAYMDKHFLTTVFGKYDVVHEAQIFWAKENIEKLSKEYGTKDSEVLKTLCFLHIPMGEYKAALDDLIIEEESADEKQKKTIQYSSNPTPKDSEYISGCWDEDVCYAGRWKKDVDPVDLDNTFEVLSQELGSVEAYFCGHDHVNSALVKYKGVLLNYGYSVDNEAYGDKIMNSGTQRGAVVITLSPDGTYDISHKNAYTDYGCSTDIFAEVYLDKPLYTEKYRTY